MRRKLDSSHKLGNRATISKLASGPEPGCGFTYERTRTMAKLDASPLRKGASQRQQKGPAKRSPEWQKSCNQRQQQQSVNEKGGGGVDSCQHLQTTNSHQHGNVERFEQQWRERLGNQLYGVLSELQPQFAGKITGCAPSSFPPLLLAPIRTK